MRGIRKDSVTKKIKYILLIFEPRFSFVLAVNRNRNFNFISIKFSIFTHMVPGHIEFLCVSNFIKMINNCLVMNASS